MPHALVAACLVAAIGLLGCAAPPASDGSARAGVARGAVDRFELLLAAADHEALYTLAGGLKPMSTGIWRGSFEVGAPDLAETRAVRAALAPLRTDAWYADVQVFDTIHDDRRSVHAYVVHRDAFARMIERFEAFWASWGITPETHPAEVVGVVDRMPRADRWRGYGYLFGYPADAVDFFVRAGIAADEGGEIGPGKDREFIQIPTFGAERGRFTYAVPLGHARSAADDSLRDEALRILGAYTERRGRIGDARRMVAALEQLNRTFERSAARAAETRDARHTGEGAGDAVLDR